MELFIGIRQAFLDDLLAVLNCKPHPWLQLYNLPTYVLDSCGDLLSIQDKILGFGLAAMVLLIAIISLIGAIWHMN